MTKPVAVEGDVSATPGEAPVPPAVSGVWTAGPVSYSTYSSLTVDGTPVAWQSSCTFSFDGEDSNGIDVSDSETVTLEAGATILNHDQHGVLLDGDEATGAEVYSNTLSVSASGHLRSD